MKTKRIRRSREEILAITGRWTAGELDVHGEARRHRVGVATILRWRKLACLGPAEKAAADFIEFPLPAATGGAAPMLRLCWPDGFAVEWSGVAKADAACDLLRRLGRT